MISTSATLIRYTILALYKFICMFVCPPSKLYRFVRLPESNLLHTVITHMSTSQTGLHRSAIFAQLTLVPITEHADHVYEQQQ